MIIEEKKRYTYADYARLPEGAPYQLIGGELIMSPSPVPYHQQISRRIEMELINFVESNNLGEVLHAPLDVVLAEEETYQPDIVFISKKNQKVIGEKNIQGAPDLVIEILSESTAYYDLRHKKNMYESFGVKEYWIVDPKEKSIEVFEIVRGKYVLYNEVYKTGHIQSKLITGFKIDIEKIF